MLNLRLNDNTINKNKSTDQTISYTHLDLPSVGFKSNEKVVGGEMGRTYGFEFICYIRNKMWSVTKFVNNSLVMNTILSNHTEHSC